MERYFRPIAHSGSQSPPSGGESSECSCSQAMQITVSTSTIDASTSQESSLTAVSPVRITCHLELIPDKPNQPRPASFPKVSFGKGKKSDHSNLVGLINGPDYTGMNHMNLFYAMFAFNL